MSCSFKGCKLNKGRKNKNIETSFHRFPKDEHYKSKWLLHVKKKNWTWKLQSVVCSKHFTPDCFEPNERIQWRRLKENALPTLYLSDPDILASTPEQMDVYNGERVKVSSNILDESHCNIDIKEEMVFYNVESTAGSHISELNVQQNLDPLSISAMGCTTFVAPVCFKHEPTTSREEVEISQLPLRIAKEPLCGKKQRSDMSPCTTCNDHEKTITRLQKELERARKVSQARLRKINSLSKRLSRQCNKTDELYSILIDKRKEEDTETEYLTELDDMYKPSGHSSAEDSC